MTPHEYAVAEADRRDRSRRHIRAEAERDLARRRRLMERVRAAMPATLSAADVAALPHPAACARGIA